MASPREPAAILAHPGGRPELASREWGVDDDPVLIHHNTERSRDRIFMAADVIRALDDFDAGFGTRRFPN